MLNSRRGRWLSSYARWNESSAESNRPALNAVCPASNKERASSVAVSCACATLASSATATSTATTYPPNVRDEDPIGRDDGRDRWRRSTRGDLEDVPLGIDAVAERDAV